MFESVTLKLWEITPSRISVRDIVNKIMSGWVVDSTDISEPIFSRNPMEQHYCLLTYLSDGFYTPNVEPHIVRRPYKFTSSELQTLQTVVDRLALKDLSELFNYVGAGILSVKGSEITYSLYVPSSDNESYPISLCEGFSLQDAYLVARKLSVADPKSLSAGKGTIIKGRIHSSMRLPSESYERILEIGKRFWTFGLSKTINAVLQGFIKIENDTEA